jgi:hypothetical protein
MKTCRENLNKLRSLCDELSNRDEQLKINASTLWDILERVNKAADNLTEIQAEDISYDHTVKINAALIKLSEISDIVTSRGCKKVQ